MGEVYRATDTKLKREVAIKVLPDDVAGDKDRLARFEREAHVLASLNHPHIASIYGLEESDGVPCLVLELVEGQTLTEMLAADSLPVNRALEIARQIALALEAAHEKGIVHRDLKPANVKITPEGSVKVLDFGLAKGLVDGSDVSGDPAHSPTLTAMTQGGLIMGTAAYMSPEQARGKQVDRRTDIWAFGCVLYEMLMGRQAFQGETVSDVIARILEHEPDWQGLPSATPLRIRELLQRCLRKEQRDRLHDVADARIEIEEALAEPSGASILADVPSAPNRTWLRSLPWAVAALLAVALGGLSWLYFRPAEPEIPLRLSVNLPSTVRLYSAEFGLALSPDGTRMVITVDRGGTSQLYLREFGNDEAVPLPGTENGFSPFFSPNGEWVGFTDSGGARLMKVSVGGGSPIVICDGVDWGSGSWGLDDSIIYTKAYTSGLWRVPASGGTPEMLTTPDASQGELGHWWPQILPGGREVLFTSYRSSIEKAARIVVRSLETGEQRLLAEGAVFGRYVPTGHLLYARGETLFAVPVDAEKLEPTGPPVPVLDNVATSPAQGWSAFSIARNGTLAFISQSILFPPQNLIWVDPEGTEQEVAAAPQRYFHPRLSPDGLRLALSVSEDVWLYELSRGTSSRLTSEMTSEDFPVWTADGKRVIYRKEQPQYDIYWRPADGSDPEELLYSSPYDKHPSNVSPDGKELVFHETHPDTRNDIWLLSLKENREPTPLVQTPFQEGMAAFSPDGHWLAYISNESGRYEVYVQPFPGPGGRERISIDGATTNPVWSRDGKELFYLSGPKMMAVSIDVERGLMVGKPRLLFEGQQYESRRALYPSFDVAPDGRFLMIKTPEDLAPRKVNVVLNWFEELERLVPAE